VKLPRPLPESTLVAWLTRIGDEGSPPDRRLAAAATDLIDTISGRPEGTQGALYRFGNTLGTDGWPIGTVNNWLQLLLPLVDRKRRKELARYSAHATVAQGWADGFVRGAHTGMCLDPASGLATAMVLQLGLQEVYDRCSAVGSVAPDHFCLVLIDIDLRGLPRLEADLLVACVAATVWELFHQGETIARSGNRVMVLAARSERTEQRAETLGYRLRMDPATSGALPTVTLDELPADGRVLNRYLRDLVG